MPVVVKWCNDGEYLASMYLEQGSPRMGWSKDRKAAIRFDSAKDAARCWRRHTGNDPFGVTFVRLVPKRRVKPEPAAPLSEPTARDAVAGMLLRYGFAGNARDLARGADVYAVLAGVREFFAEPGQSVCVAALEALARGDLRRPTNEQIRAVIDLGDSAYARGVEEGERRAKAKVEGLVAKWDKERVEHRETAAIETALIKAGPGRQRYRFGFARGGEFVADNCVSDLCDAFDIEVPPTDPGQPPTGGEPAPEDAASAVDKPKIPGAHGVDSASGLACCGRAACPHLETPASTDERWQPGAAWECVPVRGGGAARFEVYVNRVEDGQAVVDVISAGSFIGVTVPIERMTEANGWRYVGRGEAPADDTPKTHTETCDGGVTVTAPVEMSLGEVWAALSESPALRVCLDGEKRRAADESRDAAYRQGQEEMRSRCARALEPVSIFWSAQIRGIPIAGAPSTHATEAS